MQEVIGPWTMYMVHVNLPIFSKSIRGACSIISIFNTPNGAQTQLYHLNHAPTTYTLPFTSPKYRPILESARDRAPSQKWIGGSHSILVHDFSSQPLLCTRIWFAAQGSSQFNSPQLQSEYFPTYSAPPHQINLREILFHLNLHLISIPFLSKQGLITHFTQTPHNGV